MRRRRRGGPLRRPSGTLGQRQQAPLRVLIGQRV
jgi:hypothetical protein